MPESLKLGETVSRLCMTKQAFMRVFGILQGRLSIDDATVCLHIGFALFVLVLPSLRVRALARCSL